MGPVLNCSNRQGKKYLKGILWKEKSENKDMDAWHRMGYAEKLKHFHAPGV